MRSLANRQGLARIGLLSFALLSAGRFSAHAVDLDPLFRITDIKVTPKTVCTVFTPGSTQAIAAVEGRAYPFGTRVVVGPGASCKVFFDPINECTLSSGTAATFRYDAKEARTVLLEQGSMAFKVDEEFKPDKTINIETVAGRASALQGSFKVSQTQDAETTDIMVDVACDDGKASFKGLDFQVATLDNDDELSLRTTRDKRFIKVINVKGGFTVDIRDNNGNPRNVQTKPGQALKIWRKPLPISGGAVVTILITSPEGTLLTTPEGTLDKNAKISYRVNP